MRNSLHGFFAIEKQMDYSAHLHQTIKKSHTVQQQGSYRQRLSFPALVVKQLWFVALKIWLIQGAVLSVLCALFLFYYDRGVISFREYIPRRILALCAGIIALCTRPVLLRPIRYRMLEIEQSTYFSIRGSILAKLLFIGIGDVGMLTVLTLMAVQYRITADTIYLFLVIPFLTAAAAGLMLWARTAPIFFHKAWIPICMFVSLLACEAADKTMRLLPNASLSIWICYGTACVCILWREYRRLYHSENMEEMYLGKE